MKNKETNRMLEEAKLQLIKKEAVNDEKLEIVTNDLENALQRAVSVAQASTINILVYILLTFSVILYFSLYITHV